MTLEEKIAQMSRGGAKGNGPTPAIERYGIAEHIWGTECVRKAAAAAAAATATGTASVTSGIH